MIPPVTGEKTAGRINERKGCRIKVESYGVHTNVSASLVFISGWSVGNKLGVMMLVSCFTYSLILKTGATCSSQTSVETFNRLHGIIFHTELFVTTAMRTEFVKRSLFLANAGSGVACSTDSLCVSKNTHFFTRMK